MKRQSTLFIFSMNLPAANCGVSINVIATCSPSFLRKQEPSVFFLDSHFRGNDTENYQVKNQKGGNK